MLGQLIDGEFQVKELLGEGSFGSVYLCEEVSLTRHVAMKVLKPDLASEKDVSRFLSEAKLMAGLNHPNVVQIYRIGNVDGRPYIVLEYLPGKTLRQLRATESLDPNRGLKVMAQVALGLSAIHELGIVHRDLSPNNIMVGDDDVTKIVDLGMARRVDGFSTTQTEIAGTIRYLAPEVIDGKSATPASDVFSFGVNLYELLTARHPFDAEHHMSVLFRIVDRPHQPLQHSFPQAPPDLCLLVDQCLEKDPHARLTDLQSISVRLGSIDFPVEEEGGTTRILSRDQLPVRSSGRNPYLNRVMIKNPADFFGRKQEIKRISARLNASPPGSVSIVGERKIGKSSLLNHIYNSRVRAQYLEDPNSMIMVYVDLQQQTGMTLPGFVDSLLGIAGMELRGRLDVSECTRDLAGVKSMVERLDNAGYRLVLLLDEFEAITGNANFDLEFFSFLRFLANHYNVAYITSSAQDLQRLCHTEEIRDSPFFNIFTTMRLSVFQDDEALELIRNPSERAGHPLAPLEDQILAISGCFPFFLQIACCHAIEHLEDNSVEPFDFSEVERRFYEEARLHYRFLWDQFGAEERTVLRRVASGRKLTPSLEHVREELERKRYLQTGEKPRLFSTAFQAFLESEISRRVKPSLFQRVFKRGA